MAWTWGTVPNHGLQSGMIRLVYQSFCLGVAGLSNTALKLLAIYFGPFLLRQ